MVGEMLDNDLHNVCTKCWLMIGAMSGDARQDVGLWLAQGWLTVGLSLHNVVLRLEQCWFTVGTLLDDRWPHYWVMVDAMFGDGWHNGGL